MTRMPILALLLLAACSAKQIGTEADQPGKNNTSQPAAVVESSEASGPEGLLLRKFEFDTVAVDADGSGAALRKGVAGDHITRWAEEHTSAYGNEP